MVDHPQVPRRVSNPPNPWLSTHVEWLDEPPRVRLEIYEERARSVLAQNDSPDIPFRYSVNPYRGCQHACAYCYARAGHQYLSFGAGTDFDSKIVVKTNAAEALRRDLARSTPRGAHGNAPLQGEWIAFSGVTDCYQPLEACYGLTRDCLEVCLEMRVNVGIVTKSALVRRDAGLLARFQRFAEPQVFVSIPFADDATARRLEPAVTSISRRFETLGALSQAGLATGVAVAPLIPGLNDSHVAEILERAREAGAAQAFAVPLRLPGAVRAVFEERLQAAFPERAAKIRSALGEMRAGQASPSAFGQRMRGSGARYEATIALFELTKRRLGYAERAGEIEALRPQAASPARPARPGRPARPAQGTLFDGASPQRGR
jgi:DNA repair photolyase